ncbi:hypothetical protein SpCBS45565_g00281 [Spizellomyces sp. 'palustris']|nr:hypothetical protein SpCBS45565_g00281 [Spizellomyces sp. 'palustris']
MSHQSGIRPSEELLTTFNNALQATDQRAIKVVISEEVMTVSDTLPVKGSWEEEPCFVLCRMDSTLPSGDFEWILLQYVPDYAKVRDKMLYASTKATLTKELGDSKFVDTLYGTTPGEMSLDGYRKHIAHKEADVPLTEREIEAQAVRLAESSADIGISSRRSHAQGVTFPFSDTAKGALRQLKDGKANVVVLSVDLTQECMELDTAGDTTLSELPSVIEPSVPRFVFFTVQNAESDGVPSSTIFIYVCPPESKVKERMLYSSSRASVVAYVEGELQLNVVKKFEVDSVDEVDEATLTEELYPKQQGTPGMTKRAFARPTRPGRGPARVSRAGTPSSTGSGDTS